MAMYNTFYQIKDIDRPYDKKKMRKKDSLESKKEWIHQNEYSMTTLKRVKKKLITVASNSTDSIRANTSTKKNLETEMGGKNYTMDISSKIKLAIFHTRSSCYGYEERP